MRQRSLKIRRVFAELRHAFGDEIPAIELLRLAAKLVDAAQPTSVREENVVSMRRSMDQLPLDEAFADGGWRIMARDRTYHNETFEADPCLSARAKSNLNRLLKRAA